MTTRIGVISDTHLRMTGPELWPEVATVFQGVDLILHAGDLYDGSVLDWLERLAPIAAVRGNGDEWLVEPRLENNRIIEIGGIRIGMVHALWYPGGPPIQREINRVFGEDTQLDVLVLGDSHVDEIVQDGSVLVVNPGSPTYPRNLTFQKGTVAIITVENGTPSAAIIDLKQVGS